MASNDIPRSAESIYRASRECSDIFEDYIATNAETFTNEKYREQEKDRKLKEYREQEEDRKHKEDRKLEEYRGHEEDRKLEEYRGHEEDRKLKEDREHKEYRKLEEYREQEEDRKHKEYRKLEEYRGHEEDRKLKEDREQEEDRKLEEDRKHKEYRKLEEYRKHKEYRKLEEYREQEEDRKHKEYRKLEEDRKHKEYRKLEEDRKHKEYRKLEEYRGHKERSIAMTTSANEAHETLLELRSLFRQWAAYVGAFAPPRASLDARLENHRSIREIVLDLLFMLQQNLKWAKRTRTDDTAGQVADQHTTLSLQGKPESKPNSDEVGLPVVRTTIDRLLEIGVALRHSGWHTRQPKLKDEDLASTLLREQWLQKRYRNIPKSLKAQLSRSIYIRTTSMDYMRLHNERLAVQREEPIVQTIADEKSQSSSEEQSGEAPRINVSQTPNGLLSPTIGTIPSLVTTSQAAGVQSIMRKPTGTIISQGVPVYDAISDELSYPDMPKTLTACPICACPLQFSHMKPHEWRLHIEADLEPYVCISEDCREPLRYFKTLNAWESHMQDRHTVQWTERIHTERWYCDLEHYTTIEFDQQDSFEAHLTAEHGKQLTTSQLHGRLRRNKKIAARDILICPICDCKPKDIETAVGGDSNRLLWAHIGTHLKSLAFLSLPYERFVAGESQSVFNLASTHKDDPSDDPLSNTKERDASADFAAIPETVVLEDGNCEVHDQHQVAMFRAETELSEADTVAWTILSLEVKQMFTHYTDYEELAKGLEATDEKPNQRARGIGIGEDRNLRDEIFALCQRSNYQNPPQDYFPDGAVRRLITEEAVLNEFEQVDNWESLIDLDAFSGLEILRGYPSRSPESFSPWVTENAHKTFANALISDFDSEELAAFMLKFTSRGFTDANLPSIEDIRSISNIIGLSIAKKKMFYNNRWKFLAPIFFSDQHEYLLSDESILPFTKDPAMSQRGAFGTVSKVWIHQDHYKVQIPQEHHKVFTMSSFAIRKLNTQGRSTLINPSIDWEAEASVLQQINKLKHNHLPRCFATIEKGDRRYLMFPWADGGSLRDYWNTREESGPNALLIQETVEQLRGLADGLHHLHNFGKFEKPKAIEAPRTPGEGLPKTIKVTDFLDVNVGSARKRVAVGSAIRLGDLNPENILRVFDEGVDPHRIMERLGTLQIGDMALVKNHLQSADLDNQLEDTGYGTVRYEAPEAMGEVLTRRSRLYDVWSMGCITFEFVVWILHGKNGLGQFYAQLGVRGSFFEYQGRRMPSIVHPVVSTWISHMIDTDPECSRPTAIRDLLQVIRNQLLVVELPSTRVDSAIHSSQRHRATAAEFRDSLDKIVFNISHESADYLHTGMSREHVQPPTRESNVAGAAAKSEYSGGSLESFPRIQIPNTTSNATGGADVQEPQASSGKGFTRTDKWPVPKFTGGQLVHKAVFANGRREKGVFTIFATRRNGAHGYYEYQLQDSNTELIADAGDWTHERDLDSGDRAV